MSMNSEMGRLFTFPQDLIIFFMYLICLNKKNINKSENTTRKVPT